MTTWPSEDRYDNESVDEMIRAVNLYLSNLEDERSHLNSDGTIRGDYTAVVDSLNNLLIHAGE